MTKAEAVKEATFKSAHHNTRYVAVSFPENEWTVFSEAFFRAAFLRRRSRFIYVRVEPNGDIEERCIA